VRIGNPLEEATLCGPLHSKQAVQNYKEAIKQVIAENGKILYGGKIMEGTGNYVQPTITEISMNAKVVQHEVFVPILHTSKFKVAFD
jgi:aldehyde dehydrogenase family 7 protein A1